MAKKEKRIDYISKAEDIRLIASGANAEHRTMTWREATEYWERDNGTDDYGRAALMAYLCIATAGERALLDNLVDAPEDDAPEGEEETAEWRRLLRSCCRMRCFWPERCP